jgi:hypothetical protein
MRKAAFVLVCALAIASASFAQDSTASTAQAKPAPEPRSGPVPGEPPGPKFVRSLTNVQVELLLTDQMGTQPAEKKTVSMIVSSGNWGKVRSAGSVAPIGSPPFGVELNVDARPFVSTEGQIQLELLLEYSPPTSDARETLKTRPTGMNQSLTVILQSGKPLVVSQAADPVSDRKVVVEVKATVLK